jgi:hypothetical protein
MPQSIYARTAARGFPAYNYGGQSGQGALPDSTALPASAGLPDAPWTDPNNDPGSVPATLPLPEEFQLGLTMWGLPGAINPDNTPRTHAAPHADPTAPVGVYVAEADAAHGPIFTGIAERQPVTLPDMRQGRTGGQGSSADTLQPLTGQIRSQAGFDAVQGYGGGGPGPGGVNDPQGPTTDLMTFAGETYHNVIVSAAEKPFLSTDAVQFIASAPELPPYMPTFDVPTANVSEQATVGTDSPAQGPALGQGLPAYAGSFWS